MNTQEWICTVFGCTAAECAFIDNLLDEKFPSFGEDWDDDILVDFNKRFGSLCNYLIRELYNEVISYYVEKGLDENKFDCDINSVCSELYYDDESVCEEDLEKLVEKLLNPEDKEDNE